MEYRRKLSNVGGGGSTAERNMGKERDIKEEEEEMEAGNDMNAGEMEEEKIWRKGNGDCEEGSS